MINYGIIGFGRFAEQSLAPAFRGAVHSRLAALQKRDPEAARQAGERWSARPYTRVEDLVKDPEIQAVFCAGVNSERCRETILAAEAGRHVLVEKPMAMDAGECQRMIDACRRNGVQLMVAQVARFSPAVLKMRELVASGVLGDIALVHSDFVFNGLDPSRSWLYDRTLAGGGPIFDVGVHCLDTLRFVLQDEVVSLRSLTQPRPTRTRTESSAVLALGFAKGTLGTLSCSFATGLHWSLLRLSGSRGNLSCSDFTRGHFTAQVELELIQEGGPSRKEFFAFPVGDLYTAEIDHFSQVILGNLPCLVPGEEGLINQCLLDQAIAG